MEKQAGLQDEEEENGILICQGAEARVYLSSFLSHPFGCLLKHREVKRYRCRTLDSRLRGLRVCAEGRNLVRARSAGVDCPAVFHIEEKEGKLYLEWIYGGVMLKDLFHHLLRMDRREETNGPDGVAKEENAGQNNRTPDFESKQTTRPTDHQTERPPDFGPATNGPTQKVLDLHSADDRQRQVTIQVAKRIGLACVCLRVGEAVRQLHGADIVHGDLTTSNLMLRISEPTHPNSVAADKGTNILGKKTEVTLCTGQHPRHVVGEQDQWYYEGLSVCVVDFGLSCISTMVEDKAVDLYVLERAIDAAHPRSSSCSAEKIFSYILEGYKMQDANPKKGGSLAVLHRLDSVRARGRKRAAMVG